MSKAAVWFDERLPMGRGEIALMRKLARRAAIDFVSIADEAVGYRLSREVRPGLQRLARLGQREPPA